MITEEKQNSARTVPPSVLYKFSIPMTALALIDTILYFLSQNIGSALLSLVTTGIYFVLTLLQIGLIPVCAAGAIFFWVARIAGGRMDRHSWISLSLIILSLIWAVAKLIFLLGEFGV